MTVITEDLDLPGGGDSNVGVEVTLADVSGVGRVGYSGAKSIVGLARPGLVAGTTWSLNLVPNVSITDPVGTVYRRRVIQGVDVIADNLFTAPTTSLNLLTNVTAAARTSNVVTLTMASTTGYVIGDSVTVDLVDASYDGTFVLTNVTGTTLVYPQTAANAGTSTGTVGRPWRMSERLTTSPVTLPTTESSNELDVAELASSSGAIAVTAGFGMVAVPNLIVTVPDIARPVYLDANAAVLHSLATAADRGIAIAAVGSTLLGQDKGRTQIRLTIANTVATGLFARGRLAAHSPGDYQMFVFGETGNVTVNGDGGNPARLVALAV